MKIVNWFLKVFLSVILAAFVIYFLTGYDSAFEADQHVIHISLLLITNLEIMVVIMILKHINGFYIMTKRMKTQPKLSKNLDISFYSLILV